MLRKRSQLDYSVTANAKILVFFCVGLYLFYQVHIFKDCKLYEMLKFVFFSNVSKVNFLTRLYYLQEREILKADRRM